MNASQQQFCASCGYALSGLPDDAPCPECRASERLPTPRAGRWLILGTVAPPLIWIALLIASPVIGSGPLTIILVAGSLPFGIAHLGFMDRIAAAANEARTQRGQPPLSKSFIGAQAIMGAIDIIMMVLVAVVIFGTVVIGTLVML